MMITKYKKYNFCFAVVDDNGEDNNDGHDDNDRDDDGHDYDGDKTDHRGPEQFSWFERELSKQYRL